MATATPIILVHGAWSNSKTWNVVAKILRNDGHKVVAIDLPSHGSDPALPQDVGLSDYASRVAETLHAHGPSLLVGHSMGGMAVSTGAELVPDMVRKLVYVAAFLPQDGQSLVDLVKQGENTGFLGAVLPGDCPGYTELDPQPAADFLFHDATPELRELAMAGLDQQPNRGQTDRAHLSADGFDRIPRAYVICEQDRTVPPALQRRMIENSPCAEILSIDSGHVPQLSQPEKLAAILTQL